MACASSGGGFSRNRLVCWLWGSSRAGGCHCNPGYPPQWKRVTVIFMYTCADPYSMVSVLPQEPDWSIFHFPMKGAAGGEKVLVGGWSSAGHRVPAAAMGIESPFPCSSSHLVPAACSTGCSSPRAFRGWVAAVRKGSGCVAHLGQLQPAVAVCGLLGKHCQHARDVRRGLALCVWPCIPAEGVVQMLGAKEEWPCPSESAQPAKSSFGGMLCLPAIAAVHTHTPGWRDAPAVKFGLRDLQAARSVGSCWETVGKLWDMPGRPMVETTQGLCNEPISTMDLLGSSLARSPDAGAVQVGYAQPHSALEGAAMVSAPPAWQGLGANGLAGSRHSSCGHRCLPCFLRCGSCCLQDTELHAPAVPSLAGVLSS